MNRLRARLLKTEAMLAEAQERDEARELLAIKPTGSAGAVAGDDCADPVVVGLPSRLGPMVDAELPCGQILAKERTARKAAEAEAKAAQATVAMLVRTLVIVSSTSAEHVTGQGEHGSRRRD